MKKTDLTDLLKSIVFCFYIVALILIIFGLIWARLDFTLTILSLMAILLILDSMWHDIFFD